MLHYLFYKGFYTPLILPTHLIICSYKYTFITVRVFFPYFKVENSYIITIVFIYHTSSITYCIFSSGISFYSKNMSTKISINPFVISSFSSSTTSGYFFIFNYFTIYKFLYLVNVSIYLSTMIH